VPVPSYKRHRFPPEIIAHAVWLYYRFALSFRDIEELLAARGVTVSYEAIRLWCGKFGAQYAGRLRPHKRRLGRRWHVDEVFIRINGTTHYLWRAVDQNGEIVDILVQAQRDRAAADGSFITYYSAQTVCLIRWSRTGFAATPPRFPVYFPEPNTNAGTG
jgi:putative transposase